MPETQETAGPWLESPPERRRSEQERRFLFNSTLVGMFQTTPAGRLLNANPAVARLLGFESPEEILSHVTDVGRQLWADPKLRDRFRAELEARGEVTGHEVHLIRKDGGSVWVATNARAIRDPVGEVVCYEGTLVDITGRKQFEESLRRAEERYRGIFENAVEGIFQTSPSGRFLVANPALARIYGYESAEQLMREMVDVGTQLYVDPSARAELARRLEQTDLVTDFEAQVYRRDGSIIDISENVRAIRGAEGQLLHYEGTVVDITARKQAERALEHRILLEKIITNVSTRFIDLPGDLVDEELDRTLGTIGEATGVDRAYIFLYNRPSDSLDNTHEWCADAVPSRIHHRQRARARHFPWVMEQIKAQLTVAISSVDQLPEEAAAERSELREALVRSFVCVPMTYAGSLVGFIGLDSVREERQWSPEHVNLLKILAGIAVNAFEHKRREEELRRSEQKLSLHVQKTPLAVIEWNLAFQVTEWNRAAEKIFGYRREEAIGQHGPDLIFPSRARELSRMVLLDLIRQNGGSRTTSENLTKDGRTILCEWYNTPLIDAHGRVIGIASLAQDITERVQAEERLRHEAMHDKLTGLPNRTLFLDRLDRSIRRSRRRGDQLFAVLFLDLDRFKVINDSLGHMIGDQLLCAISERLETCLRASDTVARIHGHTVARLGGDEFTILLEDISDSVTATRVAERVQKVLSEPFHLGGHEVYTTVSIGIAFTSTKYGSAEDLLRDADIAMYRAKMLGKARHAIFDTEMHARAAGILQLETDLRRAMEREEFYLQYQPIVELASGQLAGFEALLRWRHPERGIVAPGDFIPVAEETGLIIPIGLWALKEACRQARQWQAIQRAEPPLTMCVNVSGKQFKQVDLVHKVEQALRETGLDGRCLRLEITESTIMDDAETTTTTLNRLRDLGVQLSIDDFGTGYSSLSYLHRFPTTTLKIDRSFVSRMADDSDNLEIVRTIVILAHNLRLNVTAEGVETAEQYALLRSIGCEYGQGFWFARPLSAIAAQEVLSAKSLIPKDASALLAADEASG